MTDNTKNSYLVSRGDNGDLIWLPTLKLRPEGFNEKAIGLLIDEIDQAIRRSSPEEQKVSVLGTNVPGILFVYASPIVLAALLYYFLNHTAHLVRLVRDRENVVQFRQFSWLPLALRKIWVIEVIGSIIVLPIFSLIVLYLKLRQFGPLNGYSISLLAAGVIACSAFGAISLRYIKMIRECMVSLGSST